MFPRVISRCGNTIELSGALSCPEVVRNCIDEESPLKLKLFKTADLPRSKNYPIQRELSNLDDDFYSDNFSLVRAQLMEIIANEEYELETRLYVIANLANKISTFYHRGCKKPETEQIQQTISELSSNDFILKLGSLIKEYDADTPISMIVVHSILSIKLQQSEDENISKFYEKIIHDYDANNDNATEVLAENLDKIRSKLDKHTQKYIDKAITRYIVNCLYREWFVSMPDPFIYVQMLLVRMAILRSLIYLDLGRENKSEQAIIKQKIVYVMYNFARNIDQNMEFLKVVYNALSEQNMMNFDFSLAFIRIS